MTRIRALPLALLALLTTASPCLMAMTVAEACPMGGCADPEEGSIGSADCCCAPSGETALPTSPTAGSGGAPARVASFSAEAQIVLPAAAAAALPPGGGRSPEPVPLFLLNASLLI